MKYNINDLKAALEQDDRKTVVNVIRSVFNTLECRDADIERLVTYSKSRDKQIAELEEAVLVHIGMNGGYLAKETVEGFVYYWTENKYNKQTERE